MLGKKILILFNIIYTIKLEDSDLNANNEEEVSVDSLFPDEEFQTNETKEIIEESRDFLNQREKRSFDDDAIKLLKNATDEILILRNELLKDLSFQNTPKKLLKKIPGMKIMVDLISSLKDASIFLFEIAKQATEKRNVSLEELYNKMLPEIKKHIQIPQKILNTIDEDFIRELVLIFQEYQCFKLKYQSLKCKTILVDSDEVMDDETAKIYSNIVADENKQYFDLIRRYENKRNRKSKKTSTPLFNILTSTISAKNVKTIETSLKIKNNMQLPMKLKNYSNSSSIPIAKVTASPVNSSTPLLN